VQRRMLSMVSMLHRAVERQCQAVRTDLANRPLLDQRMVVARGDRDAFTNAPVHWLGEAVIP